MAKKFVEVEKIKEFVNRTNRESTCGPDQRDGWNSLLECILHGTGNYRGYNLLTSEEVPLGQAPGVCSSGKEMRRFNSGEKVDETRRKYY